MQDAQTLSATFSVDDGRFVPREATSYSALERLGLKLLKDERDLTFLKTSAALSLALPFGIAMFFVPYLWVLAPVYWFFLFTRGMDRFILMLHATYHRPIFKKQYRLLRWYIPHVLGLFYAQTPNSYYAHHLGMHHPENNLPDDLSSTMKYQRDDFGDFLKYWARFFFVGYVELLLYMARNKRWKIFRMIAVGELLWWVGVVSLMLWNPIATAVVFVVPYCILRFAMMCGNWAQHAFVDGDDADNPYRNSLTLMNSRHNRRCWNDGFHVVHHVKPSLHWSEMPGHFEKNIEKYREFDAVVFDGINNYQQVFWNLIFKRYEVLAEKLHDLGQERSVEERVALLKSRVQKIAV